MENTMYKIGLSNGILDEKTFSAISNAGIDAVEVSMPAECYPNINYIALKDLSKKYNVELWSYHLPFTPFEEIDPSSLDKGVREYTTKYFSELITKASDIGIDKFIIHPSGEPIDDNERNERFKYSQQSLDILAETASKYGACIAVEDLPRSCIGNSSDEIMRLISANDKLRVCFDTNHLLTGSNADFMNKLGDKIITVHISDYDFINERHWLPGEGLLDWKAIIEKFEEIGYKGVWMYELEMKCPKTIIRDRDLTFTDISNNAKTIFNHEQPQPFGKRKENLGMWE